MTDVVDIANGLNDCLVSAELAEMRRRKNSRQTQHALSQSKCIDCGRVINPKRKQALPHAVRCITCQNELEIAGVM